MDDPRALALPDWDALDKFAIGLVLRSHGEDGGWGDVVRFAACTAARIGEVSGVRRKDIDRERWAWDLCRQTSTAPGGLMDKGTKDKGTKDKRRRTVLLIPEIRDLVRRRLDMISADRLTGLVPAGRSRSPTHRLRIVIFLAACRLERVFSGWF